MYIKPPRSKDCVWHSGPPPHVGWWPASLFKDPTALRWWDGAEWSECATDQFDAKKAGKIAAYPTYWPQVKIKWTYPWW